MQSETSRKFRPEDYSHEKLYYDDCYKIVGPDYVFHPSDVQIIVDYLIKKIKNQDMPLHWIKLANVYEIDPEKLAGEIISFFFIFICFLDIFWYNINYFFPQILYMLGR